MPNRLATEASPYLRDHAENPIDWYPWSEEALNRARAEDKPIFLSIGYSSCHWCHVMARESFSDPKVAAVLNESFVCIKVDREERPDLDEIYVETVRLITGTAGWPLSVFLAPSLRPFYGGTYFPREQIRSLSAFSRVLDAVLHYYRTERHEIEEAGNRISVELNRLSEPETHAGELDDAPLRRFYEQRLEVFDSEHGGFGIAPKFPNPTDLQLLLHLSRKPGFDQALAIVELSLRKMAEGGICDQLGAGFHRYSTDTIWLVPHFEKMLYDNALLARAYARAWSVTGDDFYRVVAEDTLTYMERELHAPNGSFYSAQDADTGEREGGYYMWTPQGVESALGPELAALAADFYGVTEPGNFQGANVLHVSSPVEYLLQRHNLTLEQLWQKLADIRSKLLAARSRRATLRRDEKVLADWNGLALSSFAYAGRVFACDRFVEVARANADYLLREHVSPAGDVVHFRRPGAQDVEGQLSDVAFVAQGLLDLFDAGHDIRHLEAALSVTDKMVELFAAPDGGFFTTRAGAPGLIARVRNGFDGTIPSGNSVAVSNLIRLARLTGRNEFERLAVETVRRFYPMMLSYPSAFGRMLTGLELLLNPGPEVALFIPEATTEARAMLALLDSQPDDGRTTVVIHTTKPDTLTERLIPLTKGRSAVAGQPTAFVCHDFTCFAPVHSARELAQHLKASEDSRTGLLDTDNGPK